MLNYFVEFYRSVGRPSIGHGSRLEFNMPLTAQNIVLLKELEGSGVISIDTLLLGLKEVDLEDLAAGSDDLSVDLTIPSGGQVCVYKTIDDLLQRNSSFSKGCWDFEFYVANDDYYSEESVDSAVYKKLIDVSKLIGGLSDLAHYHDEKGKNKNLVYVSKSDVDFLKPVVIRPQVTLKLLQGDVLDMSLVDDLLDESGNVKHLSRERGVFRSTIIEFFQESQSSELEKFEYLIFNWSRFLILFSQNFDTYLSGYAFQKVKHEIAEIEINLAEKFSKVTNDISGKILGAPISFVALIALHKVDHWLEELLVFFGVVIAAWILSSVIQNQYEQFSRVKNAREILFSSHESLKVAYPIELQEALDSAVKALDSSESKLSRQIITFRFFCWLPVLLSELILIYKYWP